jgi:multidrug/hemolysin transport system ATP-binding protein
MVWKVIEDLKKNHGMTIFLTTHYMEEASNADHVVIIHKGKIVAEGTPAILKEKYSYDRLKVVAHDKKLMIEQLESIQRPFEKIADQFILTVEDTKDTLSVIDHIRENIKQFEVVKGTMDDVFLNVIGGESHV